MTMRVTVYAFHTETGLGAYAEREFDSTLRGFSEREYADIRWDGLYGCVMDAYWRLIDALVEFSPDSEISHWTPIAEAMKSFVWVAKTAEVDDA